MGAAAVTTGAFPAIPALAATINVPGMGSFDVPVPPEFEQQVKQLNDTLNSPPPALPQQMQIPGAQGFDAIPNPWDNSPGHVALDAAKTKVGAMYSWGAAGPYNFDCSGLVQWAYRQAGVELPRTSFEQSHVGRPIAFEDLQPGDIVVTNGGGHVGIYAGDGKLLNAVQSGEPVTYTSLHPNQVVTARRIV
ncbi:MULTISPECIES: C40 family peptidase [unclassified Nocardia]|uniref:C40 family peptidase n=1 Tax=unclassified Nocardia TaxID=2637762 RepID=UPI001CE3BAA4|nr:MULTISPECIES: NlpC/P60 family protein [unclassified Nocardia]